ALEADGLAQAQPRLDAALASARAVVVEDTLDPSPALLALGHVGEDCRVLDGDADLVIEAVQHPALHLRLGAAAAVHGDVEGVMDVVALALGAQLLLEFGLGPRQGVGGAHPSPASELDFHSVV